MSSKLYDFRKKLITAKKYDAMLGTKYHILSGLGYLRGLKARLSGKIITDKGIRTLIIGRKTKLIIRPGSAIILNNGGNDINNTDVFHNNPVFPNATTIGLSPHYIALDPPTHHLTRIDLDNNSILVMGFNTIILPGTYITANNNAAILIGDNSYLSHEVTINARSRVEIGKNVMVGQQVRIMDYDGHYIFSLEDEEKTLNISKPVIIESNVWIGFRATILKGVKIGKNSIIAANACVTTDVPSNVIVAGNPAKIVKENVRWER